MNGTPAAARIGTPQLRQVIGISLLMLVCIGVDQGTTLLSEPNALAGAVSSPGSLNLLTAYLLPAFAAATVLAVDRLVQAGERVRWTAGSAAALAFIFSAALLDLAVTVWMDPRLDYEANLYVRRLLDSGHTLQFVYAHVGATQFLFPLMFGAFWVAFLKHRPALVRGIVAARPRTRIEFLKAATGAGHLTVRQWLLPLRKSEFPIPAYGLWVVVLTVVFGISLFRWYAVLEWLDVFEPDLVRRALVLTAGLVGSLVLYFRMLARHCRNLTAATESASAEGLEAA